MLKQIKKTIQKEVIHRRTRHQQRLAVQIAATMVAPTVQTMVPATQTMEL